MKSIDVSEMIGYGMVSIENIDDRKLIFTSRTGTVFEMYHDQNCCESVKLEEVIGDLDDLLEWPILMAEKVSENDPNASESGTWTFYKFATFKGRVTLRWYGSSNGYYSEEVSLYMSEETY